MNDNTLKRIGFKRLKGSVQGNGLEWPTLDPVKQAEWERRYMENDWAGVPFQLSCVVAAALATHGLRRKGEIHGK